MWILGLKGLRTVFQVYRMQSNHWTVSSEFKGRVKGRTICPPPPPPPRNRLATNQFVLGYENLLQNVES